MFSQSKDGGAVEPLDTSVFTSDPILKNIRVQTSDNSKAGVYVISYEASLLSYPSITTVTNSVAYTQTITVDPCSLATVSVPT